LKRHSIIASLSASVGLFLVGTALAGSGSTTVGAYGGTAAGTQGQVGTATTASGGLPFTGTNVALIVLVALGLVVVGFMLRRRSANG